MLLILVASSFLIACNRRHAQGSSVASTVAPIDGAENQAQNVSVSVTFDSDIAEPETWEDVFTLRKDSQGETLCTSVTYSNLVATCAHLPLEGGASYTAAFAGIGNATGSTSTFGVFSLEDANGQNVDSTGSTVDDWSTFTSKFSEAMNADSLVASSNITMECGSDSTAAALLVTEIDSKTYAIEVEDWEQYESLECTMTFTTGITTDAGTALAESLVYTFTTTSL